MKNCFTIILLVILCSCISSNDKRNNTKEKKEFRNYDFAICINLKNPGKDFDYIINRKYWRFEGKNNFVYHDDKLLEEIYYEFKSKKNNNEVEKISVKTIKYKLDKQQLDTLYLLTAKLFKADTLNLVSDTTKKECNYDGPFHEVSFSSRKGTYKIQFTNLSEGDILEKYKDLLAYIESLKKKTVKKPD